MSKKWGPWMPYCNTAFGNIPDGTRFQVEGIMRGRLVRPEGVMCDRIRKAPASGPDEEVFRYRIRKPKGMELIEAALQGKPIKEDAL